VALVRREVVKKYIVILAALLGYFCVNVHDITGYQYPAQYYNYAEHYNYDTGIVIIAYNRPHYFKQVVDSLVENAEAQTLPFFFVLDGGIHATQQENIEIINNADIKTKYIIARDHNYGCGHNILDARRFMFEWCGFEKVFVFEDDMIVSPQYISLVLNVYRWAQESYDNVGAVQAIRVDSHANNKTQKLNGVCDSFDQWWAYCMDKRAYYAIKEMMDEYEDRFLLNWPQDILNRPAIAGWMCEYNSKPIMSSSKAFPAWLNYSQLFNKRINYMRKCRRHRDGQDVETHFAFYKAGLVKITTVVPRACYIGKFGMLYTPRLWQLRGHKDEVLNCYAEDINRNQFVVC